MLVSINYAKFNIRFFLTEAEDGSTLWRSSPSPSNTATESGNPKLLAELEHCSRSRLGAPSLTGWRVRLGSWLASV